MTDYFSNFSIRIIVAAIVLFFLFLAFPVSHAMAESADSIIGFWNTPDNDAQFEIYKCGSLYCGKIVKLEEPNYPMTDKRMPGRPQVDRNNPDPQLRQRPLLGLPLIIGFHYEGDNSWKGHIYNPDDGKIYNCKLSLDGENRLKVRGYIGIPLLGKTQVWTRSRQ